MAKKKIKYVLDECETDDSGCSYEFSALAEARKELTTLALDPGWGVVKYRIWKCEQLLEQAIPEAKRKVSSQWKVDDMIRVHLVHIPDDCRNPPKKKAPKKAKK